MVHGLDGLIGGRLIAALSQAPKVPTADLSRYWHTAESEPEPFVELDGHRFRRTETMVEIETRSDVGGWARWWIDPDPKLPHVMLSITDDMGLALALGPSAPGSPGAMLLEQYAGEAVGLARYGAGLVNGVRLVAVHLPVPDGGASTVLIAPLDEPPAGPLGLAWLEATLPVVEACHRVVQACGDLGVAVSRLGPAELARLGDGPAYDWRAQLSDVAAVSKDAKAILSLVKAVADLFPSDG
ncbi:hypothetical protein [Mumia sp. DW29H23]|uniref:hypothetical protein n=1 Tax=Mumia sp. DW29H23 TaxID=3421241 RepID=UPI003D68F88D